MGAAFARPDRTDGTASVPPTSGLSSKFAAGHPEARLYHSREGDQGLGRGEYGIRGQSRLASILCPPLDLAGTVGEFKLLSEPMRGVATTVHELDESHKRCAPLRTDINMTIMLVANILRLLQRVKERIDAGDEGLLLAMMDCNTDIQISGLDRHCQSLLELLSWLEEEPCGTLQAGPGLQRALIRKRLDLLKALYEFLRDKGALTADDAVLRILRGTVPHGRQDLIEAEAARAAELAQKSKARSKALSLGQSTSAVSRKTLADMVEEHSGLTVEQWLFWTERYLDRIEEDIKILAEGRGSMKLSAEGFDALVIWGVIVDGEYVAPEGPVLRYVELRRDWLRSDRRYLQALLHARDNSPAANSAAASEDTRPT